ncbi:MAG: hypothetical protein RMK01_03095 [Thermomicrobium sp.]|nr:hypothetical protein [Thermomicrobium sp.]
MPNLERLHSENAESSLENRSRSEPLDLVAITGTRGKSTTAWLLYQMVRARRIPSALWCSSGVYVNEQRLEGELQPWAAVVRALVAGELALGIQELEAPVVATVGLPEAVYRFGAITTLCGNDTACLLAAETRYAWRAHEIAARAVHPDGVLVLNADDQALLELADRSTARTVLFALHPENPAVRRARGAGLPALWCQDGLLIANRALVELAAERADRASIGLHAEGRECTDVADPDATDASAVVVIDVREAPCTLGGTLLFQIQNLMCATALALALGLPLPTIRASIRTFLPDAKFLPGSCNVLSIRGHHILVDGARHPWTLRTLVRGVRHRNPRRTFVLTHTFPWLDEFEWQEVGRILGRLNGMIVFTEAISEERLRAFQEGIVQSPYPPVLVTHPDFEQALRYAFSLLQSGDLCIVLAADPPRTIAQLERFE